MPLLFLPFYQNEGGPDFQEFIPERLFLTRHLFPCVSRPTDGMQRVRGGFRGGCTGAIFARGGDGESLVWAEAAARSERQSEGAAGTRIRPAELEFQLLCIFAV